MTIYPDEDVLPEDYPIFGNHIYIADGQLYRSDWHGITVGRLKCIEGFHEVRRCNIVARQAAQQEKRI